MKLTFMNIIQRADKSHKWFWSDAFRKLFLFAFAMVLIGTTVLVAQPVLDAVSANYLNANSPATITVSHTTGTANNRLMVVGISHREGGTISSVTYGGEDLMLAGSQISNTNARTYIYSLTDPSSGTANVVVTITGGDFDRGGVVGVMTFSNVNQVSPLNTYASSIGSSTAPVLNNIETGTNEVVFNVVSVRDQNITAAGSGQIAPSFAGTAPFVNVNNSGAWYSSTGDEIRGAGSIKSNASGLTTSMSWTSGNGDWSMSAVSIKPIPTSDVSITKTVNNSTPFIGQAISFTLTASNLTAGSTAPLVFVNDLLPEGYTFVSATPSAGTYNAGNGVWTIGDLVNGTPRTLTITAVVRSVNAYLNIASISSENNVDPVGGNNTAQVTIVPCLAGGTVPLFGNQP